MKKILIIILMCLPLFLFSQGKIAKEINQLKGQGRFKNKPIEFFSEIDKSSRSDVARIVSKYKLFKMNSSWNKIVNNPPEYFSMKVFDDTVLLYKVDINPITNIPDESVHYRGSVDGDPNSVVSFSFSRHEMIGAINNDKGNWVLGNLKGSEDYIYYNDKDLLIKQDFKCGTVDKKNNFSNTGLQSNIKIPLPIGTATTNKCVSWYWEVDYDIYYMVGPANVAGFISGVFNQVATLYANDGMSIKLRKVRINTKDDGFNGSDTYGLLYQFGDSIKTGFDADFAMRLSNAGGGGIAWSYGGCDEPFNKVGIASIYNYYNTVPTYSWTVDVLAHEQGHILGSGHTHACAWGPNNNLKIDDCGDRAGYSGGTCPPNPPLPVGGGTIMSYCHLIGGVGINFNKGFGPEPSQVMINAINSATCLYPCTTCTTLPIPDTITGAENLCISGINYNYSTNPVAGATSYLWTNYYGWTVYSTATTTTPSYTLTSKSSSGSGYLTVQAINSCGKSPARFKFHVTRNCAITCIDTAVSHIVPCPIGQTGIWQEVRKYSCATKTWGPWTTVQNTCTSPPTSCIDTVNVRYTSCQTGYTGQITEQRIYSCSTKIWSAWTVTSNTCTPTPPPPTGDSCNMTPAPIICPSPYIIIVDSINQRLSDVIVVRRGFTNYTYRWCKNGVPKYTVSYPIVNGVKTTKYTPMAGWSTEKITKVNYTKGDVLSVLVSSQGTPTSTKCWKEATAKTTIR